MQAMGGDIVLASRLGVGTTVTLILPAEAAVEATAQPATTAPPQSGSDGSTD